MKISTGNLLPLENILILFELQINLAILYLTYILLHYLVLFSVETIQQPNVAPTNHGRSVAPPQQEQADPVTSLQEQADPVTPLQPPVPQSYATTSSSSLSRAPSHHAQFVQPVSSQK